MEFRKYQHIERFGTTEVEYIEVGKCYLFPKIDGTNSQVYLNDSGEVCAGSRNRVLSLDKDNGGFLAHMIATSSALYKETGLNIILQKTN